MMRAQTILVAAALGLAGCSETGDEKQPLLDAQTEGRGTVAASLSGTSELRTFAAAMASTQLFPVLDGKGDYTVLAPSDAAFEALGEKGKVMLSKEQQPIAIAILRGHILPGQVTAQAIEKAIARKQGPVSMATMAGGTVTFAKRNGGLTVSNGAATASVSESVTTASNGAILQIDKVLMPRS